MATTQTSHLPRMWAIKQMLPWCGSAKGQPSANHLHDHAPEKLQARQLAEHWYCSRWLNLQHHPRVWSDHHHTSGLIIIDQATSSIPHTGQTQAQDIGHPLGKPNIICAGDISNRVIPLGHWIHVAVQQGRGALTSQRPLRWQFRAPTPALNTRNTNLHHAPTVSQSGDGPGDPLERETSPASGGAQHTVCTAKEVIGARVVYPLYGNACQAQLTWFGQVIA